MSIPPRERRQVLLTHVGRKSGKPYVITIWYVIIDGQVWIGSLDRDRGWVKNVVAAGSAKLDFGDGPAEFDAFAVGDEASVARFRAAVLAKYPLLARLMRLLQRGKQGAVFRLRAKAPAE